MKEGKKILKFFLKSEKLDWQGNVISDTQEVDIQWEAYDPTEMMMNTIVKGDLSKVKIPFGGGIQNDIDFMRKYSKRGTEFEWDDFEMYVSVESETICDGNIKFVVFDRFGNRMKWVEA